MTNCFISHTWREGEHHFAVRLAEALKKNNIEVWIDKDEIFPSTNIKKIIERGIRHESDVFLFIMSSEALKSKMCKYELKLALNQMEEYGKPIVPIFFKECEVPNFLKDICYADFKNPLYFNAAVERLVKGIKEAYKIRCLCLELCHPDPEKRSKISEILGQLKNPLALGPLKNRLLSDEFDFTVKHFIALAIGEIGGIKAVDILVQAMGEEDLFVQRGVIKAMIEASESIDKKVITHILKQLTEAIKSSHSMYRLCAVKILIALKGKNKQIESMLCRLIHDPDKNIQRIVKEYFQKKGEHYEDEDI